MKKALIVGVLLLSPIILAGCSSSSSGSTSMVSPKVQMEDTEECVIKGNISSSGEKIYHLPGCASYSKTQISLSNGEEWFCSESEARSAGWRKARNC